MSLEREDEEGGRRLVGLEWTASVGPKKNSGVCMGEGSPWAQAGGRPGSPGAPPTGVRVAALRSPARTERAISGRVPSTLPKSTPFLGDRSQERGAPRNSLLRVVCSLGVTRTGPVSIPSQELTIKSS